jgi:hypothetical protein
MRISVLCPTRCRSSTRRRRAVALALTAVLAVACGDDGAPPATTATAAPTTTTSSSSSTTAVPTTSAPPATTARPATTTTATAANDESQIRAAFIAFFDGTSPSVDKKVALLENGEKYRSMLVDASANAQFQKLAAAVRSVQLTADASCAALGVGAPCAVVTFDLTVGGFPMLAAHVSPAVKIDGTWKVAAKAWCDVVAIGGDSCPS